MEIFKIIPGTNDRYEINKKSDIRRVVSRVKNNPKGHTRKVGGKVLSQKTKSTGYKEVALYIENQKCKMAYVHRLMFETFKGHIPPKYEINHKDGNKANNLIDNLELVTPSENRLHAYYELGSKIKTYKGDSHGMSKVNSNDVLEIRDRYANGENIKEIYKDYGLSLSSTRKICYRSTWKHI